MPMTLRHQARILVMQSLYEWDLADHDPFVALEHHITVRGVSVRVAEFATKLVTLVVEQQQAIDVRLAAAAPERPLIQMARIEKAILRLAISEILFDNGVPARAAINEAVELAKTYGGEHSARFVNGVLGTIYEQIAPAQIQQHRPESEEQHNGYQPELGFPQDSDR